MTTAFCRNRNNNAMYIKYRTKNPYNFLSWRRYAFLSHLTTKSQISVRWIKKPVAVTDGVHASIHFYNLAIASVTAGSANPTAHFCVRGICSITNNGVPLKNLKPKPKIIFTPIFAIQTSQILPTNFPFLRRYAFLHVRLLNHKYLSHQQKTTICEQFPLVQNGRALFIKVSLFLFQYLSEFFAMQIFPQHCLHGQSKIS